jgi:hypothetical protein
MKPGYLYVLVHPSNPCLYKIGVTTLLPEERLTQHNRNYAEYPGRIVKETGQKWEIKTYLPVADVYWAEKAFWGATPLADIPFLGGVEVQSMEWSWVEAGLDAASKADVQPGPEPLPDYVYAYTASIRKRLEGRGITLLSYVRSVVSGKADFRCDNGHEWRVTPMHVAEGEGCPVCGIGKRPHEVIRRDIQAGVICLLTHPAKPGLIKIGLTHSTIEEVRSQWPWGDWEMHRYRNVEKATLAESIVWQLLGKPLPHDREPIEKELSEAEDAFRKLIYVMRGQIALVEKAREAAQKPHRAKD